MDIRNSHNKAIAVLILLFSTFFFGDRMDSPRSLVYSYLNDYQQWNNKAYSLSEAEVENAGEAMKTAKDLYHENIISKYCQPNFKGEPIAFGSESSHDPENELILTEKIDGNNATITTKHTDRHGFVADYEYRLSKDNARWFLDAVDYVDLDGKYPCL